MSGPGTPFGLDDLAYSKLDETDRELYDAGLMDINGKVTNTGWEMLKQLQFERYKTKLSVAVQAIKKAKGTE